MLFPKPEKICVLHATNWSVTNLPTELRISAALLTLELLLRTTEDEVRVPGKENFSDIPNIAILTLAHLRQISKES